MPAGTDPVLLTNRHVLTELRSIPAPVVSQREVEGLVRIGERRGARRIVVGHARDQASVGVADRLASAWERAGGQVSDRVTWPEQAASWLRPARRLVATEPDLWLLTGDLPSLAQVLRRLAASTSWEPGRTLLTSQAAHPTFVRAVGRSALAGVAGVFADGESWRIELL